MDEVQTNDLRSALPEMTAHRVLHLVVQRLDVIRFGEDRSTQGARREPPSGASSTRKITSIIAARRIRT